MSGAVFIEAVAQIGMHDFVRWLMMTDSRMQNLSALALS
jgi:hypothetical protein